jgi:DNA-binding CsgD family transcriptional regulator
LISQWVILKEVHVLQAIIEGFVDGVLILTEQGEWVHANDCARRICHQLSSFTSEKNSVPQPIWHVCESLIDSRDLFPGQKMIIESEIHTNDLAVFRIRIRWLELDESERPYLLVTIEDRRQSTQNAAIADAKKYGFTPREAQIWLLRRANHSYKEIAAQLYITLNTVKKHMKNIYAKQQANLWVQE